MSEKSTTTVMLKAEAAKGNAKAKAILALYAIAESMKSSGGNSARKRLQDAAQVMRENGNPEIADQLEKKAAALPETNRGVSWQDAMKKAEQHLTVLGKTFDDVVKNGFTSVGTKVGYSVGIEVGVFKKPEPKKAEKKVTPAQPETRK